MFSNVLRNIDTDLLQQQEKALTALITEERIPMNHPLVGLLGMVTGILVERRLSRNRVDVSMNWWRGRRDQLCINFHPSLFSIDWCQRIALASGLLLSVLNNEERELDDVLYLLDDVMTGTVLIRMENLHAET